MTVVVVAIGAIAAKPAERWDHFKALPAPIAQSNFAATHLASGSGSGRYQFWKVAIDAFQTEPLRGIGAGGYEAWWAEHGEFSYPIKNAHSLFLETLAELGLIGLFLILGFFAVTTVAGVTRLRAGPRSELAAALGVLAAGTLSAAIDWTWQLPAAFAGVVIAAALLTVRRRPPGAACRGTVRRSAQDGPVRAGASPRPPPAWCSPSSAASQLLSSLELDRSQRETRSGNLAQAADAARQASAIEPWSGARLPAAGAGSGAGRGPEGGHRLDQPGDGARRPGLERLADAGSPAGGARRRSSSQSGAGAGAPAQPPLSRLHLPTEHTLKPPLGELIRAYQGFSGAASAGRWSSAPAPRRTGAR